MSNNPFMKRAQARATGSHGNASEQRLAKTMKARQQPASGAMKGAKSDLRKQVGKIKFRMESKSTVKDTLPLDLGWLVKIGHEASSDGSIPAITLSFVTPEGKARMQRNADWVAVPLTFFQELVANMEGEDE